MEDGDDGDVGPSLANSVRQVNDHLQSYGLPILTLAPDMPAAAVAAAVRDVHALLLEIQSLVAAREEVAGVMRRSKGDCDRLHRQLRRQEDRLGAAHAEAARLRQQHAARALDLRRQKEALQRSLAEQQRAHTQLLVREAQYTERAAQRERECDRLSARVSGLLRDKDGPAPAAALTLTAHVAGGPGPRPDDDPADALQRRMAAACEAHTEDILDQQESLRSTLEGFHLQLALVLGEHSGCVPDSAADDVPFFLTSEAIEDYFRSSAEILDAALRRGPPAAPP